ncbi:ORF6 [macacine gammaherpesvirus 12]|nr:ORF6 [Macaca nemestrina rhadinovirus 2]AJE29645.1 ORF6 [Macaca nemestrina rhadinovirus 2]
MASKINSGQPLEDNQGSRAPIGACGYVYAYSKQDFPFAEASILGNRPSGSGVLSLPLLYGLTVEHEFPLTVKAAHKKVDTTTLAVKVTCFHREVIVFHNANLFRPVFDGAGLTELCEEARALFGYTQFIEPGPPHGIWNPLECPQLPDKDEMVLGVVVTEGFKERLWRGCLVPAVFQTQQVQIAGRQAFKVPLYDEDLFAPHGHRLPRFYHKDVSAYLYNSLFTSIAQALRLKDVTAVIHAAEQQFIQDHYKIAKIVQTKQFPASLPKTTDGSSHMIVDSVVAELALSYGCMFLECPQDACELLNYDSWPIFEGCDSSEDRVNALQRWSAEQAIHVAGQLFAANSVLYLTRVQKHAPRGQKGDVNVYNSFFLQHGLGFLNEATIRENGSEGFKGVPSNALDGSSFTPYHLAYAASFSPHLLAKLCYYMQFLQHHKSSTNQTFNLVHYVGTAANSEMCNLCHGDTPATCLNTLFYRLKDRFPAVTTPQRRDPYVVTGTAGTFNDLEILGNFASFRDREEDGNPADEHPKYTYWQLCQTVAEKLSAIGVTEDQDNHLNLITNIQSFLRVFKGIDSIVDGEVMKFINSMIKNNFNFREHVKSVHHILQFCCNVYWQAPCAVFLNLYYKSLLWIIQDICLPYCMIYEQDNPAVGIPPSEWLKMHFQTLWTNFKAACLDRGVLTGCELKIVHRDMFCDFFDTDAGSNGLMAPFKMQVRIARAMMVVPKSIKIKNRIIFSNTAGSESVQSGFVKPTGTKDTYVVAGPYMKFLNSLHRVLFPDTKTAALYLWHKISQTAKTPVLKDVPDDELAELVAYVKSNSLSYDETNVLDVVPDSLMSYARIKLNGAILRACGQIQFYATTLHCLTPVLQTIDAEEYPHVLGSAAVATPVAYLAEIRGRTALTVQTTARQPVAATGRLRPVITVPMVVNKYTGVNGNNNVFHCGNLGYFAGRGVDRNLWPESSPFKKAGVSAMLRKRHVIMTPIFDRLIKRAAGQTTSTFEAESVKRSVQALLEDKDNPNLLKSVILELIRHLGKGCQDLSAEDAQYYLGDYCMLTDEVLLTLDTIAKAGVSWTIEDAGALIEDRQETDDLQFVGTEDIATASCQPTEEQLPTPSAGSLLAGKKRKINALLSDLDL